MQDSTKDTCNGPTQDKQLYLVTPIIKSVPISTQKGYDVFLKLENLQIPGSFKIRGVGNHCKKASEHGCKRIVCASGGNAGLAAAYAAQQLGLPANIILPKSTPGNVATMLREQYGATVDIVGEIWDEANKHALEMAKHPDCLYIHPFDHPDIWEGHSTIIDEASTQLLGKPDAVIVSVGGGGLMNGILEGMWRVGWHDVALIAMETVGADCLNASIKAGKSVTLPTISSVAKCLGALTPSDESLNWSKKHKNFHSEVVTDKEAVDACLRFADDHRMIVEPACGASLAAVYGTILSDIQKQGKLGPIQSVLVIVCGGSSANLNILEQFKKQVGL